jgi:hypothetical protein
MGIHEIDWRRRISRRQLGLAAVGAALSTALFLRVGREPGTGATVYRSPDSVPGRDHYRNCQCPICSGFKPEGVGLV